MLKKQLPDCHPFLRVPLQAALHEFFEVLRPVPSDLGHINVDDVVDEQSLVSDICEGWIASRQLICKASVRPDVDFLGVLDSRSDLWRDPIRCAFLRLTPRLLLGQETRKTEICNFNLAVGRVKDIVRLDIPMKYVTSMHGVESFGRLVQTVSAEVLRVVLIVLDADVCHATLVHELEDDEDLILPVVQIHALNHFFTAKMRDQSCLVDDSCLFGRCDFLDMFHGEEFAIGLSLDFEDFAEATLANRLQPLVEFCRIQLL